MHPVLEKVYEPFCYWQNIIVGKTEALEVRTQQGMATIGRSP